jgi:hypothetical protein
MLLEAVGGVNLTGIAKLALLHRLEQASQRLAA